MRAEAKRRANERQQKRKRRLAKVPYSCASVRRAARLDVQAPAESGVWREQEAAARELRAGDSGNTAPINGTEEAEDGAARRAKPRVPDIGIVYGPN